MKHSHTKPHIPTLHYRRPTLHHRRGGDDEDGEDDESGEEGRVRDASPSPPIPEAHAQQRRGEPQGPPQFHVRSERQEWSPARQREYKLSLKRKLTRRNKRNWPNSKGVWRHRPCMGQPWMKAMCPPMVGQEQYLRGKAPPPICIQKPHPTPSQSRLGGLLAPSGQM